MFGIGSLGFLRSVAIAALLAAFPASPLTAKEQTLDELKARVPSTSLGDRPQLCVQIAERQLDDADRLYSEFDSEKANLALTDVVTFSELARDYSIQSHKRQKQTEIAVRKMTRKLNDLKHVVPRDEEAGVQNAIDRLQRVRDDLLLAMFPKGEKREK
ncbi:MAG: hypothetical protein WBQ08_04850 [Candidatus Sulfotelmatobacter sp.]